MVDEDLPAPEEVSGHDPAAPATPRPTADEPWRSRRRRFVAALKPAQRDAMLAPDDADIPLLTDVVPPETAEAASAVVAGTAPELCADPYPKLVSQLRQAVDQRLAADLPILLAASLADTARVLRQTIDASIASALSDFIRPSGQPCPPPAPPPSAGPDVSTGGRAPDPGPSPHPV